MGSTAERNARLDALSTAVTKWAAREKKRLKAEASFLRTVRDASSGAAARASSLSKDLLVGTIGQFLSG